MRHTYNDTFEVYVQLENSNYLTCLEVSTSFKIDKAGEVYALTLDGIAQVHSDVGNGPLIFTMHEIAQIRFAVADAIELKYLSGLYQIA